MGATPERVQSAWRLRKRSRPQLLHLRDRDVGAGVALRSGARSVPPSSVSGAAPWQWLWQRVGASKWPPAPRRQFTKHVDLRAATFGCGSSFLAVLDPSAAFPAVLRARSAVVFAGLRLVVGIWAETRQILWISGRRAQLPKWHFFPTGDAWALDLPTGLIRGSGQTSGV